MLETQSTAMVWLKAEYHFPSVYSCRVPMTSMSSALALPAPGPATVRLALIRTSIELFGVAFTRDVLFPIIRSMLVYVRPPEKVAVSNQLLSAYKGVSRNRQSVEYLEESRVYREVAHAAGPLALYLRVPQYQQAIYRDVLCAIGYWGQANSLAWCVKIDHTVPKREECAIPLDALDQGTRVGHFFSSIVSEFRDATITWDDVMPTLREQRQRVLQMQVYIWPLLLVMEHGAGKLFVRRPLELQGGI